jgi:hypothetical protein
LFYKTKTLLLIFSVVAMLFTLGGMAYMKNSGVYKPFPYLSDHSFVGSILSSDEANAKTLFLEFIELEKIDGSDFTLAVPLYGMNGIVLYYSDKTMFPLEPIEGRIFTSADFQNHTDTVLVNEKIKENCKQENGKLWWSYGGNDFEVIGVYEAQDENGDKTLDFYINLTAKSLRDDLFQEFLFDTKKQNAEIFGRIIPALLEKYPNTSIDFLPLSEIKGSKYDHFATNFQSMQFLLIITAVLVLLNSISVCINWLVWYRKEIAVRKLCGANHHQIQRWIIGRLASSVILSGVVGIVATHFFIVITKYLPVSESTQLMFGNKITLNGVFLGMGALFLLCGTIITIVIAWYNKSTISEGIK